MAQRRVGLTQQLKTLRRAKQIKWNRFTWSGLLVILVGIILIAYGLSLNTGAYSGEGLAIGLGAIIVLVGIIRVLIGAINPAIPQDLRPYEEQDERQAEGEETLDEQLFDRER